LRYSVSATGVKSVNGSIYVTINDEVCKVSVFKGDIMEDVVSLHGRPCTLL
jgi:DUF4097 and DUF4098 domain-containing protein YvlB